MPKPSRSSPTDPVPAVRSPRALADAGQRCQACPLYANATQAVFGEGPTRAAIVLVGEQPGDVEDREGHPFVGPAGGVLDRALEKAQIARDAVYLTNAVKHFKWEPRGKRRMHARPRISEMKACWPWLEAELRLIKPSVIVCLGALATQALLGPGVTIASAVSKVFETPFGRAIVTRHPSSVLRVDDREARQVAFNELVTALRRARKLTE